jgi:gliding motility-associated-like protein
MGYGTYQFVWTISNGICSNSADTVNITIAEPTIAGVIAADATVCANNNSGTLSISGFKGDIVGAEASLDNGITWTIIAGTVSQTSYTYNNIPGTTQFRASVKNSVCPALYTNIVTITTKPAVTPAAAGTDQALCNVTSATLAANTPASGTGTWTSDPANPSSVTFTNSHDPNTTINGLTAGSYQFIWTISNALCADSKDTVTIIVYPPTVAGSLVADATVCATANAGTLSLTGYTGNVLQWEASTNNGVSWNPIANTAASLNYNNLTATTQYRASVQNAICPAQYSNIVTINVVQPVTPAAAGTDQALCNVTSATLAANTPASGTGTWTSDPANPSAVTFTNLHDPNTTINGLIAGSYQFIWTISNALCADSKDTVTIVVYPPTVAGSLVADATVCATANAGTLSLTGYTGTILQWETSADNGVSWNPIANTAASLNYNNLTATTQYRASVQNAICPAQYSNIVTINVVQPVTPAAAGTDQALCNVTSATLAANTPASGTGTWTSDPANPSAVTFTNSHDPNTTINGLTAGSYQFIWTISNALCADSKDTVTIIVYPPTVAGSLVADATVCATANAGTLSLTGYTGNVLQWETSTNNGVSWNPIANTAASLNYNNLTATTQYRASVQNAVCPAQYSNIVTINVVQPVTPAAAGTDQVLCNVTSATLAANTPASGTGTWTSDPANPSAVTFTNSHDPNTTINGLTAGSYQFIWTISNALCADSKDTVTIIVYPPTVAGSLVADATVCATANAGTLSLTGYTGNVLQWEASTNNGVSWNPIANTAASLNYNNLTATTQYRASVQNAICPAQYSNIVTIHVVQPVTPAAAGTDQALCNVTSATLAANTPASGTGTWTSDPANPSAVTFTNSHDPNTTINGLIAGSYQFIWTISNALCADSKDTVTIIVYPPTVAGSLIADATVCATANAGTLSLTGYTGNILQWESSADNGATWSIINNQAANYPFSNLAVTTIYRALVQSGNCNAVYSNMVTITVNPATIGGKLVATSNAVCAGSNSGTVQLSAFTGVIQHWETSVDSGKTWNIIAHSDTSYEYNSIVTDTWYRVLIQSSPCVMAYSDTAKIVVSQPTVAGLLSGPKVVCNGINNGTLTIKGQTGNIMHWEVSTDIGVSWNIINSTADTLNYLNLTQTTIYRALVQNGVCAMMYTNNIVITVIDPVTIADAGPDQLICNGRSIVTLAANTPVSGAGSWSLLSGPSVPSFDNISLPNATISGLSTGTYVFAWTISNGTCASSTDTVQIRIDQITPAFAISGVNNCGATIYSFNNTSTAAFGIKSWLWYNSNGDTLKQKDISFTYTKEGYRDMTLSIQSNTGCTNSLQALYKVTVFQFPKVNINAIADACKSQLLKLSPQINSQDSIAYLLWNLGNGTRTKDSIVTVQYVNDGNYTLKLTVATVNNCFDSAYKQITIHPIPDIAINNSPVVCKGDSLVLVASGATNYVWTDKDNNIICDGCSTTRVKPVYNITYKVLGYSQYGCSQVKTTEVRVIQPLKMLIASGDTVCVGQSKQLMVVGADQYQWYPGTGLSSTTIASPVAKPDVTTTYHVIGKDNYNCFADTAELKMVVGYPTAINIGKDTVITAGSVFRLNATTQTQDIRKWYWNSPVPLSCNNCATPELRVSDNINISCLAINRYGCTSVDTIHIQTFCPATQVYIPNAFTPDGDGINDLLIVQGSGIKMVKSFRIFNRWGEMVFEKTNFRPGDPAYGWDGKIRGKAAPPDVFVYMCEVICEKGIPSMFKGNVAILK